VLIRLDRWSSINDSLGHRISLAYDNALCIPDPDPTSDHPRIHYCFRPPVSEDASTCHREERSDDGSIRLGLRPRSGQAWVGALGNAVPTSLRRRCAACDAASPMCCWWLPSASIREPPPRSLVGTKACLARDDSNQSLAGRLRSDNRAVGDSYQHAFPEKVAVSCHSERGARSAPTRNLFDSFHSLRTSLGGRLEVTRSRKPPTQIPRRHARRASLGMTPFSAGVSGNSKLKTQN